MTVKLSHMIWVERWLELVNGEERQPRSLTILQVRCIHCILYRAMVGRGLYIAAPLTPHGALESAIGRSSHVHHDFLLILEAGGPIPSPCTLFLAFARARALAPPFVLLVLQKAQYQMSGMAVRFTLAQVRWTHTLHEEHSIIGRPP